MGQLNEQAGNLLNMIRRSCRGSAVALGWRIEGIPEDEVRNLVEIIRYVQGG